MSLWNESEDVWFSVTVARPVQVSWKAGDGFYFHHGLGNRCTEDWLRVWRGWMVAR